MITPDECTVAEAAEAWGVSREQAWRLIKVHNATHRYEHPKLIVLPRSEVERIAREARRPRGRPNRSGLDWSSPVGWRDWKRRRRGEKE